MLGQHFWNRCVRVILIMILAVTWVISPVQAAPDPYVVRYLKATEPISLDMDGAGETHLFSPQNLSEGKYLFEQHCKTCHVGGATLPNPLVSLSNKDLQGATPSRSNVSSLVAYFRQPLSYDGSEEAYLCRPVPESWMSQSQVENLAAFILRAAEKAPGWGANQF